MIIGQAFRMFVTSTVPRIPLHRHICWLKFLTIFAVVAVFHTLEAVAQTHEEPPFDGRTLHGWTTLDGKPVKEGWEVVGGMIHLKPSGERIGAYRHRTRIRRLGPFFRMEDFARWQQRIEVSGASIRWQISGLRISDHRRCQVSQTCHAENQQPERYTAYLSRTRKNG